MKKKQSSGTVADVWIDPTFTQIKNGEIAINGLREGAMLVHETLVPRILQMSIEHRLYPCYVISALVTAKRPGHWMMVLREKK